MYATGKIYPSFAIAKEGIMLDKLSFLLTKEDCKRIKIKSNTISIDLHGLSVGKAGWLIRLVGVLANGEYDIVLIHGFVHGTKIKEFIWNNKLFNAAYEQESPPENPGQTNIFFVEESICS